MAEIDYSGWKGWEKSSFGVLKPGDASYFARELREVVAAGSSPDVVEFGYGHGQFLQFCRERGWNVTGVELLPELVEAARAAGFQAISNEQSDQLPDDGFDLATAFDVLEHIEPEDAVAFLVNIREKLRPGGYLVLRFPNADTWLGNPFQNGDPTHTNAIGVMKAQYFAHEAGLEFVRFRGVTRRGFETSAIHGLHRYTAGVWIALSAAIRKALYFPDLPVVLSSGNVICVMRKPSA